MIEIWATATTATATIANNPNVIFEVRGVEWFIGSIIAALILLIITYINN